MGESINTFFMQYQYIFKCLYGLLFYSFGFSIYFHSRHFSRLILAKSLPWLGGFGILTALYEWGDVVIPLYGQIRGVQNLTVFIIIRQLICGLSLGALFQFGIELLRPFHSRIRWVRLLPTFTLLLWLFGPFIVGFSLIQNLEDWISFTSATAARFICIPASIISTIGIIRQQRIQIKPMKLPFMDMMARLSAAGLAAYGFFGGVFGPKSFLKPGVFLSEELFIQITGLNPHILMAFFALVLFYSFTRLVEIFDIETEVMVRNMEQDQVIANERERIARDLHDGALQQVYASGLLAQALRKKAKVENLADADRLINAINQAIQQLREFLPVKKGEVTTVDLVGALQPKIEETKQYLQVKTIWETENLPQLSIDQARHLAAFLTEAMSNVIRHSKSTEMDVKILYHQDLLTIEVRDYGEGISPSAEQGYGLRNMRERAKLLGAELLIDSERHRGTTVRLELLVKEAN